MKFLVVGGAGYVGSHFVKEALAKGHDICVFDNLSRGFRWAVPSGVDLIEADVRDSDEVAKALTAFKPDVVFHYAAFALVGESVEKPEMYEDNNVGGTKGLLSALEKNPVPLVFSSTCAVYGTPDKLPIDESMKLSPESPYGETKLSCEKLIKEYCAKTKAPAAALRYFNACGAASDSSIGEAHEPETHLVPNVFLSLLGGEPLSIFGGDFLTRDGTCVRDYIHVTDLALSHLVAAEKMVSEELKGFNAINLGTGDGYSNLEIVKGAEKVSSKRAQYEITDRRAGDPAELYADNTLAKRVLGFETTHSDIDNILTTAWRWHSSKK